MAEANTAGWVAPAIRIEDGGDEDEGESEDGENLGQHPIPPSQELLVKVAGFTRRAEHPTRSAGSKKRRVEDNSTPEQTGPSSVVPMSTAGFVLAQATDPEVFRRLDEMRAVLGRLEREVVHDETYKMTMSFFGKK